MAMKTVVIDDIDGTEGASTVTFALEGATYEIDLSDHNRENLRKALEPFIFAARPQAATRVKTGTFTNTSPATPLNQAVPLDVIREWARSNGYSVSDRGRVPSSVRRAFDQARTSATDKANRASRETRPANGP